MQHLEERDIGFETGIAKVPLVCQSCIFDLGIGDKTVRPTKEMAYEACEMHRRAVSGPAIMARAQARQPVSCSARTI